MGSPREAAWAKCDAALHLLQNAQASESVYAGTIADAVLLGDTPAAWAVDRYRAAREAVREASLAYSAAVDELTATPIA